jgi:hypothetical protein
MVYQQLDINALQELRDAWLHIYYTLDIALVLDRHGTSRERESDDS